MVIPKVIFRYSWVYDQRFRALFKGKELKDYPSGGEIVKYISRVKPIWAKQEKRIFLELSKIMGLKWRDPTVICYTIGKGRSFSDPLTVKYFENKNDFVDCLTHEMIHQLQSQHQRKWDKWRKMVLDKKFKDGPMITQNHILLHAVHKCLLLNEPARNLHHFSV